MSDNARRAPLVECPTCLRRFKPGEHCELDSCSLIDLAAPVQVDGVIQKIEAEARRYAEMYPQPSDGRNTFVIFADWVAALSQGGISDQVEQSRHPEIVAAVQEALMKHPFWKPGLGSSGFAFGLANTAIDAYVKACSAVKEHGK